MCCTCNVVLSIWQPFTWHVWDISIFTHILFFHSKLIRIETLIIFCRKIKTSTLIEYSYLSLIYTLVRSGTYNMLCIRNIGIYTDSIHFTYFNKSLFKQRTCLFYPFTMKWKNRENSQRNNCAFINIQHLGWHYNGGWLVITNIHID